MFALASDGTPRPVPGVTDKAGADGIVEDVVDCGLEVPLVADDPRGETLGEERATSSVPGVVLSGIVALVPLGGTREIRCSALEDRVVVRPHQAVDVAAQFEADEGTTKEPQKQQPVEGVEEERSFVDAVRRHVEVAVRQLGAEDSSHAPTLRRGRSTDGLRMQFLPT
jgi:hypothetical protein